ncbi:DUF6069 family protein [Aeromicrobium sp. CTD01-1L150]|uniref:DUF6069 family protein n=1 Tax=Aeromicrobium sp. CTD01-1L150 TaxID=3341830 RepID=UPI0035C20002
MPTTNAPTVTTTTSQGPIRSAYQSGLSWWSAALLAAVAAVILNVTIWSVARLAGSPVALDDNGAPYPIAVDSVAVMSVVPTIAGIALAALIARWWIGILRVAQVVGASLALATLMGVFSGGAGTAITLILMHLVSGTVVVLALEGIRRRAVARQHAPGGSA